ADDVDLLSVVDLVPDRLEHFAEQRRVRVVAVHDVRHVAETDVALLELARRQHANATAARDLVLFEREVHLFDPEPLGVRAELGLGAVRASAEKRALLGVQHPRLSSIEIVSGSYTGKRGPRRVPYELFLLPILLRHHR